MRRIELVLFVSGVLAFSACGSSGGGGKDAGAGKGGHGGGGSGGSTAGSGGSTAGSGGSTAGSGGSTAGSGGSTAGMDGGAGTGAAGTTDAGDAPTDMAKSDATDATDAPVLSAEATRGQYLVGVLGCSGCHTPNKTGDAGTGPDTTRLFAGVDCFAKDTATNGCLSSANLTPDATGIKNLTDAQVMNAFRHGIDPDSTDAGTIYLFANMPWYQFTNLSDTDAMDIVAYLRSLPAVPHAEVAPTGFFATPLTAPQWTPVLLANLPNAASADGGTDGGGTDAGASSIDNGKYFASLLCVTCHTVNTGTATPLMLDAAKAFQGGKTANVTVTVPADGGVDGGDAGTTTASKSIESANLTPDVTGLAGWSTAQISNAIINATDNMSRSICGMRKNTAIKAQDALDIANYLQAIPAVANTPTPTCY
jgi:cytochrome c2